MNYEPCEYNYFDSAKGKQNNIQVFNSNYSSDLFYGNNKNKECESN